MNSDPLKPTGYDEEAVFDQWAHEKLRNGKWRLRDSSTVTFDYRHDGIYANVKREKSAPQVSTPSSPTLVGTLLSVYDNYIVLKDLVSGATIRAAKMYHLRNSIQSETTLDGTIWNFTYPSAVALKYQARTKSGAGISEYQRVTKVYCTNPVDQISYSQMPMALAAAVNIKTIAADGGVTVGTLVTYLEEGPPRQWARKIDQSAP
jgi:hypothetical protein